MPTKKIALFGMFRSGTNYTRTILEWNYDCQLVTDAYEWKHGFFPIIVERSVKNYADIDMLFVTKDPFASISSLFKYYTTNGRNIHADKEWKNFLRGRFITFDSFQESSPQYRFANVVEFWNNMNWNLASVAKPEFTSAHVSYPELLANPLEYSRKLAKKLGLAAKYSSKRDFKLPSNITKNMGDRQRKSEEDYVTPRVFDSKAYEEKKYYELFDSDDKKFVLKNLDVELLKKLGYFEETKRVRKTL